MFTQSNVMKRYAIKEINFVTILTATLSCENLLLLFYAGKKSASLIKKKKITCKFTYGIKSILNFWVHDKFYRNFWIPNMWGQQNMYNQLEFSDMVENNCTSCVCKTIMRLKTVVFLKRMTFEFDLDLSKWPWPWYHQMCIHEMCLSTKNEPCN